MQSVIFFPGLQIVFTESFMTRNRYLLLIIEDRDLIIVLEKLNDHFLISK